MDDRLRKANQENDIGVGLATDGKYKEAIPHFEKALTYAKNQNSYYFLGLASQQQEQYVEAIIYYKKALKISPNFAMALNNLGVVYLKQKDYIKAKKQFKKVLNIDPNHVAACNNLGNVHKEMGNSQEAIKYYKKAIGLDANIPEVYNNMGMIYLGNNNFEKSINFFKKAIKLNPNYTEAYYHLGIAQRKTDRNMEAIINIKKHLELNPNNAEAHAYLGNIMLTQGNYEESFAHYTTSIKLNPNDALTYNDLGNYYKEVYNFTEAEKYYKKALKLNPKLSGVYNNLGVIYSNKRQYDEAIKYLKKAIMINPKMAEAHYHLGWAYLEQHDVKRAAKALKAAVKVNPNFTDSLNLLVYVLMRSCDYDGYKTYSEKLDKITKTELVGDKRTSEVPFLNVIRDDNSKTNYQVAKSWGRQIKKMAINAHSDFVFKPKKTKKIRIGYLSNDFKAHATSHLMLGLFEKHDKKMFDIYIFSYSGEGNNFYRNTINKRVKEFVDITDMGNIEAAEIINKKGIDILVDLKGHTKGNRMQICALKPSPLVVTYLGFPGTTGADFIDYMITDKVVTPESLKKYYSEKLIFLPDSYQVNDNEEKIAKKKLTKKEFGLPSNAFVFASFNHTYKINKNTIDTWINILKKVPLSVLWLYESHPEAKTNLKNYVKKSGIDTRRIIFSKSVPKPLHLKRIQLADVCLDTFICNGHTTTSDSLWAGVPVITLEGKHFASRVSTSLLKAVDMSEFVVKSDKEYQDLAVKLANDPGLLKAKKEKLAKNRLTKPLFDTGKFTKDLEKVYSTIWERYKEGKPPKEIVIK